MSNGEKNSADSKRQELLLRMYDQMFNDINRHIIVVWQPITVLIGSLVLLAAGMRDIISIDIAEALIILLVGWMIATLYDSSYWYNRNLVIIANIERQFLRQTDLRHIHYYFGKHRANKMIAHLRIHRVFGLGIGVLILVHHFWTQALMMCPSISSAAIPFRLLVILPYLAAVLAFFWVRHVRNNCDTKYRNFRKNSPGIEIDTTGIDYGVGHPIDDEPKAKEESKEERAGSNE